MKKKLALLTLLTIGFTCLFNIDVSAQKEELSKKSDVTTACSNEKLILPQSVTVNGDAFTNYIKVMSLPSGKRQQSFSKLKNGAKADVIKVGLALQFLNRPDLTSEQKDLLIESISTISGDTYNKDNPNLVAKNKKISQEFQEKALATFPPQEAFEIFVNMNGDKTNEITFLQKYEDILASSSITSRKKLVFESSLEEKSNFWKAQLIYYLSTARLNKSQREFIVNSFPYLTSKSFEPPILGSDIRNEETRLRDSLETEALQNFTKAEAYVIFVAFGFHKQAPYKDNNLLPSHGCNCVSFWGCGIISDFTCVSGGCDSTSTGCGFWGDSRCTKRCDL